MPRAPARCMSSVRPDVFSSMTTIARTRSQTLDRVERAGVIGGVDAGLHDHDAIHVQRAMQRLHFFDGGRLRRIHARRRE